MPEIETQTNLKMECNKEYTAVQLSKKKYNNSKKGAECRKRYYEKNKEIGKLWVVKSIIKKKIENQSALVASLGDDVKIKARYVKLVEYNTNRLKEVEEQIEQLKLKRNEAKQQKENI